jgi:hypothetical protein
METCKLSSTLRNLLLSEPEGPSVHRIVEQVGDRGFGLLLLILSLPSALPVPAAGYSVPFGILLLILAVQMIAGRTHPAFPQKLGQRTLKPATAERLLNGAAWMFAKLEWLVRPRMRWIGSRGGRVFMGVLVLIMAVLMMIPIPLTNTAPAMVVFLIAIGLTEEDGLFAVAACLLGVLAVLLYGALIYAMIVYGPEVATTVKDTIKAWLGR